MIVGIQLKSLNQTEINQFMSDALELVNRNNATTLLVESEYDQLKSTNDTFGRLLRPDKGSAYTDQVVEADNRRDKPISGINQVVSGYLLHFDAATARHAQLLSNNLKKYGYAALARENYQSESAGIDSMVGEWESTPELTEALNELSLTPWKDELKAANEDFKVLYLDRTEDSAAQPNGSLLPLKKQLIAEYYELRDMLNSYLKVKKGADPWATTIRQLNTLINKYEALIGEHRSGNTVPPATEPAPPVMEQ